MVHKKLMYMQKVAIGTLGAPLHKAINKNVVRSSWKGGLCSCRMTGESLGSSNRTFSPQIMQVNSSRRRHLSLLKNTSITASSVAGRSDSVVEPKSDVSRAQSLYVAVSNFIIFKANDL